jgi:hypothetical protein
MDNERLVEEVKKRSILYEQTSNSYKEAKKKDAAWREVAQELDCDGNKYCECLLLSRFLVQNQFLPHVSFSGPCASHVPSFIPRIGNGGGYRRLALRVDAS